MQNLQVSSTRDRQARWDKRNMHTISTKMNAAEFVAFRLECAIAGVKPYGLMLQLARDWMQSRTV